MGKEVRNYEFKFNDAQVYINDQGKVKYDGKKGDKKELEKLKPLFDAIAKADTSYKSDDKKVDSPKEKDLMDKLHKLLMADGKVDANELKLGDEFTKSGLSAEAFINKKLEEANPPKKENPVSEEPVDTVVKERTWVDDAREGKLDQPEQVVSEPVQEEPAKQEVPARPDPRVSANAYNQTIQNQKIRIQDKREELEAAFTNEQTITRGTTLYKLAVDALKAEGVEKPNAKQINDRIAEIALINNIDNVNNVRVGTTLKVGRGSVPDAGASERVENPTAPTGGAAASSVPATVAPSSIEIYEFNEETLTEAGYTAEEKTVEAEGEEEGFDYKEWSKEESANKMFTTEIDGVTLTAESLEELKQLRADYKAEDAKIKGKPADGEEAEDVKAARQAQNLESMKKLIELSGGNLDVVKDVIDMLRGDGNVNLESEEVQAFVQELIKTKNVEVLTALLTQEDGENRVFSPDLLGNNKASAETLASLYKEIRAKENAGEKLTDEEIALKDFFNNTVQKDDASALYTVEADEENGIIAKEMRVSGILGEPYYGATLEGLGAIYACDPTILDEFAKEFEAADTDDKKTNLFARYANTDDKVFASTLAEYANVLKASKEDVEALVAKNDMYVLSDLQYSPADTVTDADLEGYESEEKVDGEGDAAFNYTQYTKTEGDVTTTVYVATVGDVKIKADSVEALKTAVAEYKEFNNTVAERVETLYTEAAGDPANMRYLKQAFAKIDATDKSAEEKQELKDKILETYFEVTETTEGEGEDTVTTKHYTFKPSRRPTYEEMNGFCKAVESNDMCKAVAATINIEDMGAGQWSAAFENWYGGCIDGVARERYTELVTDMDAEAILDFVKNKMQKLKDRNVPYDAIIAKFPENLAEQTELVAELLNNISDKSVISFENRDKLAALAIDSENNWVANNMDKMIALLPNEADAVTEGDVTTPKVEFTDNMKKVFDKILTEINNLSVEQLLTLNSKVKNNELKTKISNAIVQRVQREGANGTFLKEVMDSGLYDNSIAKNLVNTINISNIPESQRASLFKYYVEMNYTPDDTINKLIENGWLAKDEANSVDGLEVYKSNATNQSVIKVVNSEDPSHNYIGAVSVDGLSTGRQMYKELDGIGSGKIADLLKNNVNKDNVVGIIKAFASKSPNEHLMQYIANESHDYSQGICSRVPKSLMRKAAELHLTDSDEYKALVEYFGAEGSAKYDENGNIVEGDTFKFTKNESNDKCFTEEEAKKLDQMLMALANKILEVGI